MLSNDIPKWKYYLSIIIILVISSCSECKTDKDRDEQLLAKFERIKSYALDDALGGQVIVDIFLMEHITGIPSHVSFGDVSIYRSYEDKITDVDNWRIWFKQNKCVVSSDSLRKLEENIIDANYWISLDKN